MRFFYFFFFYSIHFARLFYSGNKKELSQEKIRQIILYAFLKMEQIFFTFSPLFFGQIGYFRGIKVIIGAK